MNRKEIVEFFIKSANTERENEDGCTYWWTLDYVDDKQFAIVMGWQQVDDDYELCMKLAYLPMNSLMSEYDIDWIMPYDEDTGQVDDTNSEIGDEQDIANTIDYLLDVYNSRYAPKEELV